MRDEQKIAHDKIIDAFKFGYDEFLLAAKMRFGKNFTILNVAKSLQWKNVLVLTYKPYVFDSLKDDINDASRQEWYIPAWHMDMVLEKVVEIVKNNNGY